MYAYASLFSSSFEVRLKSGDFYLQVILEGVAGPSYQGDIALDDITFHTGACPAGGKLTEPIFYFFFRKIVSLLYLLFRWINFQ